MKRTRPLDIALGEYGITEIVGSEHNPEVLKYFHEIGQEWVDNDEMAWCSAAVAWCCMKASYEYTNKLNARAWLFVGVAIEKPELGCIVVLWRISKDSAYGHVGFFITERNGFVYMLGGNQSNQLNIRAYPKERVLGYRRLTPTSTKKVPQIL